MKLRERFNELLIDPTWEEIVERDPLIAFSHYLSGRVHVLVDVACEILEHLDRGFVDSRVDAGRIARAESLMWLWILGAYEVVRTMSQAKACFSDSAFEELVRLKKRLSSVRMPAAKMEKPGEKIPVNSNRSPAGWDMANRDLLVNAPEEQPDISARFLLAEFDRVFSSLTKQDVLLAHEKSYAKDGANKRPVGTTVKCPPSNQSQPPVVPHP
jgi:hypothetical protein